MPEAAAALLSLRNNPDADIDALVKIISRDPAISAQVLRYSRLSTFGYGERIQTLDEAITLVLGYDKALHLALGLAVGACLRMQAQGPLGRNAFWRHSFTSAILCQALAKALPAEQRPSPGLAYLAGLTHDIGFMLTGHLYPDEFAMLNKLVERYYDKEPRELELLSLGISHDMVGLYLMRAWNMPEELQVAVSEHHFPEYGGRHNIYSKLVYLADQLQLQLENNGLAVDERYFASVQQQLGLNEAAIQEALRFLSEVNAEIGHLAEGMVA